MRPRFFIGAGWPAVAARDCWPAVPARDCCSPSRVRPGRQPHAVFAGPQADPRRIDHGVDDRAGGVTVRALHQAQQLLLAVRYADGALSDVRTFEKVVFAGLYPEAAGLLRD